MMWKLQLRSMTVAWGRVTGSLCVSTLMALSLSACASGLTRSDSSSPESPQSGTTQSPSDSPTSSQLIADGSTPSMLAKGQILTLKGDDMKSLSLPLDNYRYTPEEMSAVQSAEEILIKRCMESQGFQYTARSLHAPANDPSAGVGRRYGPDDRALAQQYGLLIAPDPPAIITPASPEEGTEAFDFALTGGSGPIGVSDQTISESPGSHGCIGEAVDQLTDGDHTTGMSDLAVGLNHAGYDQATADPRVVDALANWSACMKKEGISAQNPVTEDWGIERPLETPPSKREVSTALASIDCSESVNLYGIWYSVEVEMENALIAQKQLEFDDAAAKKKMALERAAAIIAEGN